MGYSDRRHWAYELFEVGAGGRTGWYVDYTIMLLIVANVIAVMLETVDPLWAAYGRAFLSFEIISVTIFTVEYAARVWTATEHPNYRHPISGRVRYASSPYMMVDLLAILPFYLGVFVDLRFLRGLRLIRFMRVLKLSRYSRALQLFARVVRMKREELVITSAVGTILLLVASSAMYYAEQAAQPDVFSSIPAALWWGVITLTTVGYGDVHPVTPLGQVLGALVAIVGIGLFALPASILASGFIEAARENIITCPHCGGDIIDE